jgi:hypothetical protein
MCGGGTVLLPARTMVLEETIQLPSNVSIRGKGDSTVIVAIKSFRGHMLENESKNRGDEEIRISNLVIDGNKSAQDVDSGSRGLHLINVQNLELSEIKVINTPHHCAHISNSDGLHVPNQRVQNCVFTGSRLGSGFATSYASDVFVSGVSSYSNRRAGFRLGASGGVRMLGCHARECGDGGFVPVSGSVGIELRQCVATECGAVAKSQGFHLVGQSDVSIIDCIASDNFGAGLLIENGCSDIKVVGGEYMRNGQGYSQGDQTPGRAGIYIAATGRSNRDIYITGVKCFDDQLRRTQLWGVEINDKGAEEICVSSSGLEGNLKGEFLDRSRAEITWPESAANRLSCSFGRP